jgi:tRNA isopentenyl-2-thiomethyl-A-37 hydroxylase MiaE
MLLLDAENLSHLQQALADMQAECIAVPPFTQEYLCRGHAVHIRCHEPEADRLRLDIMAQLRGVEAFPQVWERRTTLA